MNATLAQAPTQFHAHHMRRSGKGCRLPAASRLPSIQENSPENHAAPATRPGSFTSR